MRVFGCCTCESCLFKGLFKRTMRYGGKILKEKMAVRSGFKQPYDLVETLSGKVEEVMKNAVNVAEDMQVGRADTCTAGDTVFRCFRPADIPPISNR